MQEIDYYEVLGVSVTSDQVVIRAAYKAMMLKYHPDTNRDPGAEERAKQISRAFEVLSNAEKRKAYDAARGRPRPSAKSPPPAAPPPPPKPAAARPKNDGGGGDILRRLAIATMKVVIAIPVLLISIGAAVALNDSHNKYLKVVESSQWLGGFQIGQPREEVRYRFRQPDFVAANLGDDDEFELAKDLPKGRNLNEYPVWRWNNFTEDDIITIEFDEETNSIKNIICDGQSEDFISKQRILEFDGSCEDFFSSQSENYGLADTEEYKDVQLRDGGSAEKRKIYHFDQWGFSLTYVNDNLVTVSKREAQPSFWSWLTSKGSE